MNVLTTERLSLRKLSMEDAEFVLALLNEPSFLRYIGDKGVRTLDDARKYIVSGPLDSYNRNGFGLYLAELKASGLPIGICGLVSRPALPDPDIGFAFLPTYWSKGYAVESAAGVLTYAREALRLQRILAITSPDNQASGRVLERIGFRYVRVFQLSEGAEDVKLFEIDL